MGPRVAGRVWGGASLPRPTKKLILTCKKFGGNKVLTKKQLFAFLSLGFLIPLGPQGYLRIPLGPGGIFQIPLVP